MPDGRLDGFTTARTPALQGSGLVREGNPEAFLQTCRSVLDKARGGLDATVPLGIASQRSSFLIWKRSGGRCVTPIVSWQDRRAHDWCQRHAQAESSVHARTGLTLSPHYAGPKLASMIETDAGLGAGLARGELCFGTLDTWLGWSWSAGARFQTDLGMAARTLMVDAARGDWCDEMLELFGVPRCALAEIQPTSGGRTHALDGGLQLAATVADQASGLLAVLDSDADGALFNLGTGCFVLRPTSDRFELREGYLTGPLLGSSIGRRKYALEGTINAGGKTADRMASAPTEWPAQPDPEDAFCLPDENGVGAPYWRAQRSLTFSESAGALSGADRRRLVLEGLLFRAHGILEDLCPRGTPGRMLISGGLSADPIVATGIASLLRQPVEVLEEAETTLLGCARLAAGLAPLAQVRVRTVEPDSRYDRLRQRYPHWKAWVLELLG